MAAAGSRAAFYAQELNPPPRGALPRGGQFFCKRPIRRGVELSRLTGRANAQSMAVAHPAMSRRRGPCLGAKPP